MPHIPTLRCALFCTLLVGFTGASHAADAPSPEALERGLAGRWTGALEYRDYQSNRSFKLPTTAVLSTGPDGATMTRLSSFDDGPKTGVVTITTVSLFDASGMLTSAMFRKGRAVEMWSEAARVSAYEDATHWTLVYQRRGQDDDKAADIRITQTRRGAELSALKEVKPVDAPDSAYVFRNQTVLTLQTPQTAP